MLNVFTPPRRYIPKVNKHEESLHKKVCTYLRKNYPQVIFRSDYAAGLQLTKNQARVMTQLNSGRGYPDLFVAFPVKHKMPDGTEIEYHGLYLELKQEGTTIYVKIGPHKGELTANQHIREQDAVIRELNKRGYFARFAVGFDRACKIIDWYFDKPQNAELF